jgi:hypothetical protein
MVSALPLAAGKIPNPLFEEGSNASYGELGSCGAVRAAGRAQALPAVTAGSRPEDVT